MSIILGKIVWSLLTPGSLLLSLLLLALILSWWTPSRRWGIRLGVPVGLAIILLGAMPSLDWMIRPLEDYYPVPRLPSSVDGIVVLGGAEEPGLSAEHEQPQVNGRTERLITFADLAHRYPDARLVFTGRGAWSDGKTEIGRAHV